MEIKNTFRSLTSVYTAVLSSVLSASGCEIGAFAASRAEVAVTARVVLVDVLVSLGMSEGVISKVSSMSQQRVNRLKNSARLRLRGLLGKTMRKEVGDAFGV